MNDSIIHREDSGISIGDGKVVDINWVSPQIPQQHALISEFHWTVELIGSMSLIKRIRQVVAQIVIMAT